ncbi:hypothetical protein PMIN05_004164 [Paraphaeosphaeria minitans]
MATSSEGHLVGHGDKLRGTSAGTSGGTSGETCCGTRCEKYMHDAVTKTCTCGSAPHARVSASSSLCAQRQPSGQPAPSSTLGPPLLESHSVFTVERLRSTRQ